MELGEYSEDRLDRLIEDGERQIGRIFLAQIVCISRIGGIDIMPSMTRMTMPSAQRTKPETSSTAKPASEARMATEKPTASDTRVP